jgi:hypothetical protein
LPGEDANIVAVHFLAATLGTRIATVRRRILNSENLCFLCVLLFVAMEQEHGRGNREVEGMTPGQIGVARKAAARSVSEVLKQNRHRLPPNVEIVSSRQDGSGDPQPTAFANVGGANTLLIRQRHVVFSSSGIRRNSAANCTSARLNSCEFSYVALSY